MAKKRATQQTKAKGKPSNPVEPTQAPGAGGSDPPQAQAVEMDSAVENFIPMQTPETIEERIERLRRELPEGYDIFSTEGMIDFGSMEEPEPQADPHPSVAPMLPEPYYGRRVVFERDQRWVEKPAKESIKDEPPPLAPISEFFNRPADEMKKIGRDFHWQFFRLSMQALNGQDIAAKNAAGRAIANIMDAILTSWPEKATYRTCISAEIRQIKDNNEGFKQRWNKELHRRGVANQRGEKDKPLERFVVDAEQRLASLAREIIHAMFGGEHPIAKKEAAVLLKWMQSIPGLMKRVKIAQREKHAWPASIEINEMVDDAKLANVEDYFNQVFKPALENGLWQKVDYLGERKFSDHQGVMLTILRKELARTGY